MSCVLTARTTVEPAAVAELEEMTAKAHRLNAQHRELHHSIAQLSSEFGHDMALRTATVRPF